MGGGGVKLCPVCLRPKFIEGFGGEGGAGVGYMRAGFCVDTIDKVPGRKTLKGQRARLENYPSDCPGALLICADAPTYIAEHGHEYVAGHGSPTCTGYSRGTAAIPGRLDRYDRLIGATREAFLIAGIPYVIENVEDARPELRDPVLLCGRMFNLTAIDDDGTRLTLDRHRLFEIHGFPIMAPEHVPHDWRTNRRDGIQVAGSYGGARRDKDEARYVRKGGYVPTLRAQRDLLGTPWMTEKGCQLSIPPAYTEFLGAQLLAHLTHARDPEAVAT